MARAVEIAREKAGIPAGEAHELVSYSQARFINALRMSMFAGESEAIFSIAAKMIGIPARWMPAMMHLVLRGGVMMLGPFIEF
jgi:hypothetical protein